MSTRKRNRKNRPLTRKVKILWGVALAAVIVAIAGICWVSVGAPVPGGEGKKTQVEKKEEDIKESNKDRGDNKKEEDAQNVDESADSEGKSEEKASVQGPEKTGAIGLDSNIREEMSLPYTVPGTQLVIDRMDSYSGIFIEDGSDKEVSDIFAIHVQNQGENVEYSSINLEVGGNELNFAISDLPSGAAVSVLESSAAAYETGSVLYRGSQTAYISAFDMLSSEVGIVTGNDNSLSVTNQTESDIPCLRIFYKFAKDQEYLGGITYTAKINELRAGETRTIYPSHFSAEGSKVMMVRKYDTMAED